MSSLGTSSVGRDDSKYNVNQSRRGASDAGSEDMDDGEYNYCVLKL